MSEGGGLRSLMSEGGGGSGHLCLRGGAQVTYV